MSLVESLSATHGRRILQHIAEAGERGKTDHEIERDLGIYLSSVNAARNRLVRRGEVKNSGQRRPSGRGGTATVWVATNRGEENAA